MSWWYTLNHRLLSIDIDTHCEHGDEELSTGIEGESGEDVDADGSESEDVDGQLLDRDDDLGVKGNKHLDVSLGVDLGLWVIIICELFLE